MDFYPKFGVDNGGKVTMARKGAYPSFGVSQKRTGNAFPTFGVKQKQQQKKPTAWKGII